MDQKTVNKLNQLNKKFYQQVAESFSQTRSYYWSGWQKILPYINVLVAPKKVLRVLDLGCGNGRFGQFLAKNLDCSIIKYTGWDFNKKLLTKADQKLAQTKIDYQLKQIDVINELLTNSFLNEKYDLITAFGLFHHLPSFQLRQKLLTVLAEHLQPEGLIVVTFWQFADKKRFQLKFIDPSEFNINPQELEKNDYILVWKRRKKAYRYCHHIDEKEINELIQPLNLKVIDRFLSDGKTNDLNRYLVLKLAVT